MDALGFEHQHPRADLLRFRFSEGVFGKGKGWRGEDILDSGRLDRRIELHRGL